MGRLHGEARTASYEYIFHPLKGTPKNLDRSAKPISIAVRTEPLFSDLEHDIFFNRGVASSQAYAREFDNKPPDKLPPAKSREGEGVAEPQPRRGDPEIHRQCQEERHAALLLLRVPLRAGGEGA